MAEKRMEHFKCLGEPERQIATELCEQAGVTVESVYCQGEAMAALARTIRSLEGDAICKLPFASIAEAEQLGAKWQLGQYVQQPVPGELPYKKLEDVEIKPFSFDWGIMQEVLKGIITLKSQGETVSFNLEGPFTLLGMLVPSQEIYRGMRRQPALLRQLCGKLIDNIATEAARLAMAGVDMLSYADPMVTCRLVSPAVYTSLCGEITRAALRAVATAAPGVTIHVCSATSADFQQAGFCHCQAHKVPEKMCYGAALCFAHQQLGAQIVGHGCIQHSCWPLAKPVVYELELC